MASSWCQVVLLGSSSSSFRSLRLPTGVRLVTCRDPSLQSLHALRTPMTLLSLLLPLRSLTRRSCYAQAVLSLLSPLLCHQLHRSPYLRTLSSLWWLFAWCRLSQYPSPHTTPQWNQVSSPGSFPLNLALEYRCLGTVALLLLRPGSGQDRTAGRILSAVNLQRRLLLSLWPHLFSRGPLTGWAGRPPWVCLPYRFSALGSIWELLFPVLFVGTSCHLRYH